MLLTLSRLVALPIGIFAYYVAFLMYEDEQGKWQNRIETLWISINDREKLAGSMASALFDRVAAVATTGFNRIFGRKLFSLQLIGVSTSYSYAGAFLGLSLVVAVLFRQSRLIAPLPSNLAHAMYVVKIGCFVIGAVFALFAALPSLWPSMWTVGLSLLPLLGVTCGLMKLAWLHRATAVQLTMFATLIAGVLSDVVVLVLIRYTLRRVSALPSLPRVSVTVFVQLAVIGMLVVAPIQASGLLMVKFPNRLAFQALLWFGVFNLFTGLAASAFLLVLCAVLLHRVTWPTLGRLVYPLARHEVVRNHLLMASIGTACFVFAFPLMPSAMRGILESIAK